MIREMTLGQYYKADSILHKLDPRVKLLGTLLFVITLFFPKSLLSLGIATVFLILIVKFSKVPVSMMIRGVKPLFIIICFSAIINMISVSGDMLVKMACATVRDTKEEKVISAEDQEFMILESRFLSNPGIAIEQSKTAARKMAEQSKTALNLSFGLLDDFQEETAFRVEKIEAKVDRYEDELGTYMVKLGGKNLSKSDSHTVSLLLHCIGDFERISDHALSIMKSAKEISEKNARFSDKAVQELHIMEKAVSDIVEKAYSVFANQDMRAAEEIEPLEEVIDELSRELKRRHVNRLRAGECTIEMGFVLSDITKPEFVEKALNKYGFKDWESMLASVGHGGLKEGQVVNKLNEEYNKVKKNDITDKQALEEIVQSEVKPNDNNKKNKGGILVKGIHDVAVRFSRCCNPVPGDEIVGFVTRGRGISIHRTDCINILNFPASERERLIDAEWEQTGHTGETYSTDINIFANNRKGLIVDISKLFTESNIDVKSMNSRVNKKNIATINIGFDIHGKEELSKLVDKLLKIDGITDVERTTG